MENENLRKLLLKYNGFYKEMDEVYHRLARRYHLSDTAFWVLYTLRESEEVYTQSKICTVLSLSKQTVNSALKTLEKEGYIRLEPLNQKNKQVLLTEKGEVFAQNSVDQIFLMEENALAQFSEEERNLYLHLVEKYVRSIQKGAENIFDSKNQ